MEPGEVPPVDAWPGFCNLNNMYPDQVVSLKASPNPRPRCEFLTAQCYIGPTGPPDLKTQAYVDTLASNSFLSVHYYNKLKLADASMITCRATDQYFDFSLVVGNTIHKALVIEAQLTIDTC